MMNDLWLKAAAWNNADFIHGNIRAVVVSFHGLGAGYRNDASLLDLAYAENNVLVIAPFYGPWSWMNRLARQYVDEVIQRTYAEFNLDKSVPLISSGGSMGGCSALLYCRYGKKKPAACDVLSPVCDALLHYTERPDLPTTFNYAFYGYPEPLEEILKEHSPLHQLEYMPHIPYLFIHGDADTAVNKEKHSDAMVCALRKKGHEVEYMEVAGMKHGVNIPFRVLQKRLEFVLRFTQNS